MASMGLSLRTTLGYRCPVCDEYWDCGERRDADIIEVAFNGAVLYAVCPGCLRIRDYLMDDREYRRKARVKAFERYGVVWPCGKQDTT